MMEQTTAVSIKALTETTATVAGYGVVFGGKDLYGETFSADTDFALDLVPSKPVLYDHNLGTVKHWIGKVVKVAPDDNGLWVEAELQRNTEYVTQVLALIEKGALGWSSGTAGHMAKREGGVIKSWPVLEFSLTPTPAEPRTLGVEMIKSLIESDAAFEALLPQDDAATSSAGANEATENEVTEVTTGEQPKEQEMDTEVKAVAEAPAQDNSEVMAELKSLRELLNKEPAVNVPNLNLKTRMGDDETKALTHYIRSGDNSGLKASNANDMTIADATYAGNAVPTGHYQGIIAKRDPAMLANTLGVMRIPGTGTTVNVPYDTGAANEFVATNETTAFDLDAPTVGIHAMTLVKYTKQIVLSYELLQDEDSNLMAFLNAWVGRAMALTHNKLLVTALLAGGTSVALGAVTTVAAGDPQKLVYSLKQQYASGATFLMRGATFGALMALKGDSFQYAETPGGARAYSLWGYPVIRDENMEAVASGKRTIAFGDFGYMGLREAPSMEFLRDPYSKSGTGQIVLNYYFRAVYKVLLPEALLYGQQPTA
jgi:HK97 family phage major capsid protein